MSRLTIHIVLLSLIRHDNNIYNMVPGVKTESQKGRLEHKGRLFIGSLSIKYSHIGRLASDIA